MKVMYLTWGETPRSYGIYASQGLRQLNATSDIMPDDDFCYVAGLPFVHSGLVREKFLYREELRRVRSILSPIPFHLIKVPTTQNFINVGGAGFSSVHSVLAINKLNGIICEFKPDIIHCRAYHAAWAALKVRKKFGANFRVVFDARGLWPEEVAIKKRVGKDNPTYKFMKHIESVLLRESDVTVVVSSPLIDHYEKLGARNLRKIHVSAPVDGLKFQAKTVRNDGPIKFVYLGALSETTWHKPSALLLLFRKLKAIVPSARLKIITTSDHEAVKRLFGEFSSEDLELVSTRTVSELALELSDCDVGLMSYYLPDEELEVELANNVLAVKTAEYFSAGLPLIVNKMCGGAAHLVDSTGYGFSYDPFSMSELSLDKVNSILEKNPEEISAYAQLEFSYDSNAQRYASLYRSLIAAD